MRNVGIMLIACSLAGGAAAVQARELREGDKYMCSWGAGTAARAQELKLSGVSLYAARQKIQTMKFNKSWMRMMAMGITEQTYDSRSRLKPEAIRQGFYQDCVRYKVARKQPERFAPASAKSAQACPTSRQRPSPYWHQVNEEAQAMTDYVITPAHIPSIAVKGSDARFPLRRVFCVGRNYREHTREMGHDPDREPPFFFMKPADAVVPAEGVIAYPPLTSDLHHEVELVVAIGKGGVDISPEEAFSHIWGYGLGIDLTRRDLQAQAKKFSRPWEWAKAFDESAPSIPLQPVSAVGHPSSGKIWLNVNGEQRQLGDLADQIWSVSEVISHASKSVTLKAGDLIFTGTPAGVGALQPGDEVTAGIDGIGELRFTLGRG